MKPIRRDTIPHDSRSRDAALRRLRRTNRWLIAGSAVLTGLFVDLAASAFSGHASSASAHTPVRHKAHRTTTTQPLKPPAQAPKAASPAPQSTEAPQPAEERAPEAAPPTHEAVPETTHEAAPEATREAAPETHESAPAPSEPSEPVVSGGS